VEIRPLAPSDHDDAVALWKAAGLTRPWNDARADLLRAVRGPDSTVLGGYLADEVLAGTAMVGHDGHRGWVYYLAVDEAHRRQGHARALMRTCEQWVRDRQIPKIQLMVRAENHDVIDLYEHLGYELSEVAVLGRRLDQRGQARRPSE
jgi:ribosomal protein S18 acetylase RimI-like enzyme